MDIRDNYIQQKNNRNNVEGANKKLPTSCSCCSFVVLVVYKTFLVSDNIIVFLTFKLYIIMLAMLCIACDFLNINVH